MEEEFKNNNLAKDSIEKELDSYTISETTEKVENPLSKEEQPKVKKPNIMFYIVLGTIIVLGIIAIVVLR